MAPHHVELKLGLAGAYYQQQKNSPALVIVEDLLEQRDPPAAAYVWHAKLLLRAGEPQRAAYQYREALEIDPASADAELARELGVIRTSAATTTTTKSSTAASASGPAIAARPGRGRHRAARRSPSTTSAAWTRVKEEIRMKIILPLAAPGDVQGLRQESRRRHPACTARPAAARPISPAPPPAKCKAGFLSVGISDVLDMWIGSSEKNLHELFEQARRNKPCVLFFDEVDALGASRADMRHSGGRHLINQFLAELDGVDAANDGVLILAATNAPWHLDNAFRRPGRFDRILFVPPPDQPARAAILRLMLTGKPADGVDFDQLAKKTGRLLRRRLEGRRRPGRRSEAPRGDEVAASSQPLRTKDLLAAAGNVKPSTREWFATARNYALYSNQGGVYDDILKYLKL